MDVREWLRELSAGTVVVVEYDVWWMSERESETCHVLSGLFLVSWPRKILVPRVGRMSNTGSSDICIIVVYSHGTSSWILIQPPHIANCPVCCVHLDRHGDTNNNRSAGQSDFPSGYTECNNLLTLLPS